MNLTIESFKSLSIDGILVSQKDNLLYDINSALTFDESTSNERIAENVETLKAALYSLRLLKDLWIANGYGYKFNELLRRIDDKVTYTRSFVPQNRTVARNLLRDVYLMVKHIGYVPEELKTI